MKRQQLIARTNHELLALLVPEIKKECIRLIDTGALDYGHEDMRSYTTAKTVLAVAMQNIINSRLNSYNGEDTINRENLRNF